MSDKTQALAQTAKELALAAIAGCATVYLLTLIPATAIPYIGISFCIAILVYVLYTINLGRIQYRKHLGDMEKSLKNIKG
jgi:hypothetical protein